MPIATASAMLMEPVLQLARHFHQHSGQELHTELLQAAGLSEDEFTKPGARFPADNFPQVLKTLADAGQNPLIALNLGEVTQPRMLGSIGFLMSTAATLEQAFEALIDYFPLLFEGAVLELEHTLEGAQFSLELNQNSPQVIEYLMACLNNWPRWLTGHQIPAIAIRLSRPEPDSIQPFQQFFAAEVEFDAPRNQLLLSSDYLNLLCTDANAEMHQLHREFADSLLSKSTQQGALIAQTRNLIRQQLSQGAGSIRRDQVASELGLSLRTLQRKLGILGTSFQDIYDQTRRELCLQLIQKGQLSFGEIAFQLGFSNQSAFQKAFKRWMTIPPSEYRQQIRPANLESVQKSTLASADQHWLQADNRHQILQQHLSSLSVFGRELLDCASAAGMHFDLNLLALITHNPVARLAIHFWPAERAGLIIRDKQSAEQTAFHFANAGIQDFIYQQLSQTEQQQLHHDYSVALLTTLSDSAALVELENVLQHLQLTDDRDLDRQYQRLSIRAAELASQQQDYPLASRYMQLAAENPACQPERQSGLLLRSAELQLQAGELVAMDRSLTALSSLTLSATELGKKALLSAYLMQQQGNLSEALECLLVQLAQQDHCLPRNNQAQLKLLLEQFGYISQHFNAQTLTAMAGKRFDKLYTQLRLLEQISLLARQLSEPLLAACAIGRMTEISLRYGRSPLTAFAYTSYAWVAGWFCADYSLAQTFSAQGMQLAHRFGGLNSQHTSDTLISSDDSELASSAVLVQSKQVLHWFAPLPQVIEQLHLIEQRCTEQGLWRQQSEAWLLLAQFRFISTEPLDQQRQRVEIQLEQLASRKLLHQQTQLQDSIVNLFDQLQQGHPAVTTEYRDGWQAIGTIIGALLLNQSQCWPELYRWEALLENELPGYFCISEMLFCTALMRQIQGLQRGAISHRHRIKVEQTISRLEIWQRHCPENFSVQLQLLRAEQARLDNHNPAQYYEAALQAATESGPGYHLALVHERYADYLGSQGQTSLARFCLMQAQAFHQQWQAHAKVKQLAQSLSLLAE